jgi:uncharacterized NAD-dependent epimerase/dehydratase family protein
MANAMHPCRVIGIAMNGRLMTQQEAAAEKKKLLNEIGLPVCDVLRDGPGELIKAIRALRTKLGK